MPTAGSSSGSRIARHGYAPAARRRRIGWAALLLAFAATCGAVVAIAERSPPSPRETPRERRVAEVAFLSFGAICVAFAIVSVLRIAGERGVEAIADADGLTFCVNSHDEVLRISWDAVETFTQDVRTVDYHGIPVRTIRRYVVATTDGRSVTLDSSIDRVADLATRIAFETRRRVQPRMRAAIDRGAAVAFGPLSLTREGVSTRGQLLQWDRVAGFDVDRYGAVVVRDGDGVWTRVGFAEVPNGHVLLSLARTFFRSEA